MSHSIAANIPARLLKKASFSALAFFTLNICSAQFSVTEVITDYNGYWKSSAAAINSVKPDNSHNLVAFSFNGNRYSTGVNDALLAARGQSFIAGDYRALPIQSIGSSVTGNTKIGLGYMYDGVANGPGIVPPMNNIPYYLTDGVKGLDLGTCVANLPAGTMMFPVSTVLSGSIGDGVPDILITQIADPSGSTDKYEFTDINGARVGNAVDIVLTNVAPVGNWTADFYEANRNPMTLAGGYTRTDRPVRLWASDLSAFGINAGNAGSIQYFKITLSGSSDVAFVSYNNSTINLISSLLPVTLNSFTGIATDKQVQLNWETTAEINSDAFIIERSTDGTAFVAIDKINAVNNNTGNKYGYTDKTANSGKNYYRLKMLDNDGHFEYSKTILVKTAVSITDNTISMYPNPARDYIIINHLHAGNNDQVQLVNLHGTIILRKQLAAGSFQTRIDVSSLPKGVYEMVWTNGKNLVANKLVIM